MKTFVIPILLSAVLLGCNAPDTVEQINRAAMATYKVDAVSLSYLIAGPRYQAMDAIAFDRVFSQKETVLALEEGGYVTVKRQDGHRGSEVAIERTELGDSVHEQFMALRRPSDAP